jgi:hypothetical protein
MNANHRFVNLALVLSLAAVAGCGNESSSTKAGAEVPKSQAPQQPVAVAPQIAPPPDIAPPPSAALPATTQPATTLPSTSQPRAMPTPTPIDPGPAPGMVREVAKPGVTGKGGYEEGVLAPITTPLNTYWSAKEMAVYDIAIPRAMQLFEFEKERKPNSHEEFMREIIKKNNFKLPELPVGVRYVYDPKVGRLMVERPIGTETPPK